MRKKQCHRLIYFCGLITRDEVDNTLRKWCGCANELLTSLAVLVLILTTGFMEHNLQLQKFTRKSISWPHPFNYSKMQFFANTALWSAVKRVLLLSIWS